MASWWTEMWTCGSGAARVYCGVARTDDGFAVDLFRGDRCVDSWMFGTREEAVRAALDLERRHSARLPAAVNGTSFRGSRPAQRRAATH